MNLPAIGRWVGFCAFALLVGNGLAAEPAQDAATADHAQRRHHMSIPDSSQLTRASLEVRLPDVTMVRAGDGRRVPLAAEIDDGRPVLLSFVFTTCSTICPTITQSVAGAQQLLGDHAGRLHVVSISIDPEQDTATRLREYAAKYGAGPRWQMYTGSVDASIATQKAFQIYRGDKMNHGPVYFLRPAPGRPWTRIDGFATPEDLAAELHPML
jgi:protein SCO1/2